MGLGTGHPCWLIGNGLLNTVPPLKTDAKCDLLDIGAGITGAGVTASHVVFATGYDAKEFPNRKVVGLNSSFALMSEPLPAPYRMRNASTGSKPIPAAACAPPLIEFGR